MATSITFSTTTMGIAQAVPIDQGSIAPGAAAGAQVLFIRHNGAVDITDCAIYLQPYAGGAYVGSATPQLDFEELICWGDDDPTSTSGSGVYINHAGLWENVITIRGFSEDTAIDLVESDIVGTPNGDGVIPVGEEATILVRVDVPLSISCGGAPAAAPGAGLRQFDVVLRYTTT